MYIIWGHSELNITEVAHDHQVQVMKYITEDLQLLNSYDTWHGNFATFEHLQCFEYIVYALITFRHKERCKANEEGILWDSEYSRKVLVSRVV